MPGGRPARAAKGRNIPGQRHDLSRWARRTRMPGSWCCATRIGRPSPLVYMRPEARASGTWTAGWADVTVTSEGAWRFQVEAWRRPDRDLATRRGRQDRPGRPGRRWRTPRDGGPAAAARGPQARRRPPAAGCSARRARCATPRCRRGSASRPRSSPPSPDLGRRPVRELITRSRPHQVSWTDSRAVRLLVRVLPALRWAAGRPKGRPVHGTFAPPPRSWTAIADLGFDVVYLLPMHPIGRVNRKGTNNTYCRR